MKDFSEIQKDAKIMVLMEEIFNMGIARKVNDVYFGTRHIVLLFKSDTPWILLKELQLIFKATVVNNEDGKQFIYCL